MALEKKILICIFFLNTAFAAELDFERIPLSGTRYQDSSLTDLELVTALENLPLKVSYAYGRYRGFIAVRTWQNYITDLKTLAMKGPLDLSTRELLTFLRSRGAQTTILVSSSGTNIYSEVFNSVGGFFSPNFQGLGPTIALDFPPKHPGFAEIHGVFRHEAGHSLEEVLRNEGLPFSAGAERSTPEGARGFSEFISEITANLYANNYDTDLALRDTSLHYKNAIDYFGPRGASAADLLRIESLTANQVIQLAWRYDPLWRNFDPLAHDPRYSILSTVIDQVVADIPARGSRVSDLSHRADVAIIPERIAWLGSIPTGQFNDASLINELERMIEIDYSPSEELRYGNPIEYAEYYKAKLLEDLRRNPLSILEREILTAALQATPRPVVTLDFRSDPISPLLPYGTTVGTPRETGQMRLNFRQMVMYALSTKREARLAKTNADLARVLESSSNQAVFYAEVRRIALVKGGDVAASVLINGNNKNFSDMIGGQVVWGENIVRIGQLPPSQRYSFLHEVILAFTDPELYEMEGRPTSVSASIRAKAQNLIEKIVANQAHLFARENPIAFDILGDDGAGRVGRDPSSRFLSVEPGDVLSQGTAEKLRGVLERPNVFVGVSERPPSLLGKLVWVAIEDGAGLASALSGDLSGLRGRIVPADAVSAAQVYTEMVRERGAFGVVEVEVRAEHISMRGGDGEVSLRGGEVKRAAVARPMEADTRTRWATDFVRTADLVEAAGVRLDPQSRGAQLREPLRASLVERSAPVRGVMVEDALREVIGRVTQVAEEVSPSRIKALLKKQLVLEYNSLLNVSKDLIRPMSILEGAGFVVLANCLGAYLGTVIAEVDNGNIPDPALVAELSAEGCIEGGDEALIGMLSMILPGQNAASKKLHAEVVHERTKEFWGSAIGAVAGYLVSRDTNLFKEAWQEAMRGGNIVDIRRFATPINYGDLALANLPGLVRVNEHEMRRIYKGVRDGCMMRALPWDPNSECVSWGRREFDLRMDDLVMRVRGYSEEEIKFYRLFGLESAKRALEERYSDPNYSDAEVTSALQADLREYMEFLRRKIGIGSGESVDDWARSHRIALGEIWNQQHPGLENLEYEWERDMIENGLGLWAGPIPAQDEDFPWGPNFVEDPNGSLYCNEAEYQACGGGDQNPDPDLGSDESCPIDDPFCLEMGFY